MNAATAKQAWIMIIGAALPSRNWLNNTPLQVAPNICANPIKPAAKTAAAPDA